MRLTEPQYRALLARDLGTGAHPSTPPVNAFQLVVKHLRGVEPPEAPAAFDVTLTLPWPPSVNAALVYGNRGRMVARRVIWGYRAAVCVAVAEQWPAGLVRPLSQRLALTIVLYANNRRRRDLDNILKVLADSLSTDRQPSTRPRAGVYVDDSQIDHLSVTRGPVVAGAAHVTVRLMPFP